MAEGPAPGNIRPTGPIWPVRKVDKREPKERQAPREHESPTGNDETEDDGKPHVDTYA